jgi:hypothetical protein
LLEDFIYKLGVCKDDGKVMCVDYNGNVFPAMWSKHGLTQSGNIFLDSFSKIKEHEARDPFVKAEREEGVGYIVDIAGEVEPRLLTIAKKTNVPARLIGEIVKDPALLLYVTKRILKEDLETGLAAYDMGGGLLELSREALQKEYSTATGKLPIPIADARAASAQKNILIIFPLCKHIPFCHRI